MDLSPPLPAAPPGDALVDGLDAAIDSVAAAGDPRLAFLTRSWFTAALGDAPARTLVARAADGSPILALPVTSGRFGIRTVPGGYWPFRSFPVAGAARLPGLARELGRAWRIGPIEEDDPALDVLRAAAGWTLLERPLGTAFLLDFAALRRDGPWPRPSSLKKNRFHEKHLAAHGALDWRFWRGADWTPAAFDALAIVERKSWQAGATDPKFVGRHRAFWERLAADPVQAERMGAAMLFVAGEPAAFSFDLDCGDTRYAIANSYDPAFAKHSPGKLLQYKNLADAEARGIARVDWGSGDGGYKQTLGAVPGPRLIEVIALRGRWPRPIARAAQRLFARGHAD